MGMIGERVVRTEDPALLTGDGTFVDNIPIEGAVHVVYARAQMAHARIVGIDSSEAIDMPGVLGVFTAADLDLGPFPLDIPFLPAQFPRTALASDASSPTRSSGSAPRSGASRRSRWSRSRCSRPRSCSRC